jgi:uncharacterized coiled-coil protein SlyX
MLNSLLDIAAFTPRSLAYPDAWCGHLPFAAWIVKIFKPRVFVELGTHSGNSYFTFCQSVVESDLPTACYAVDTWKGEEHAGLYGEDIFQKVIMHNQEHYGKFSQLMRMTFDDAAKCFSDGFIDLLHIDGMHTYEAVKHDFETWLPKLAPGAVILLHDTNERNRGFGVWKWWEELQEVHANNFEFTHSHGLGVLQLDNGPSDMKLNFLDPSFSLKEPLKKYFSALGTWQLDRLDLCQTKRQLADLSQALVERDRREATYENDIVMLGSRLSEMEVRLAEREARLAELDAQFASLQMSRSWRITKPLRALGTCFRAMRAARNSSRNECG